MARVIAVWLQFQNKDGSTYFVASDCSLGNGWEKIENDDENVKEVPATKDVEPQDISGMSALRIFIRDNSPIKSINSYGDTADISGNFGAQHV